MDGGHRRARANVTLVMHSRSATYLCDKRSESMRVVHCLTSAKYLVRAHVGHRIYAAHP